MKNESNSNNSKKCSVCNNLMDINNKFCKVDCYDKDKKKKDALKKKQAERVNKLVKCGFI